MSRRQHELESFDKHHAHHHATIKELPEGQIHDNDTVDLARAGKKQVLTRRFALLSIAGFAVSVMATWEGVLVVFLLGYQNGGPAGLIYGFLGIWAGTFSVFATMGELSSMVPTSGGQYHYVSLLAPTSSKNFLSYAAGWATVAGWVAATTTGCFFVSSLIEGIAIQNHPGFAPQGWEGTLIFWAVLSVCLFVVAFLNVVLPAIEIAILIIHILGFFAIIIPLVHLGPIGDAKPLFTTFVNSGWETQALSFFIGLNGNISAFVGADSAIHMSEEVKGASKTVPRSMLYSILLNGTLGFGMLLAVLFCAGDLAAAADSPTGFPFMAIFENAVGSRGGANAMISIVIIMSVAGAISALASASRMMWSFARDNGLPGSGTLSTINARTNNPLAAIFVVALAAALIGLINIGSSTAFNDVVSLIVEAFSVSYLLPCSLLLYRRVRGEIHDADNDLDTLQSVESSLRWGKWKLGRRLGLANNVLACAYLVVICFFAFWPSVKPVTAENMNYSSLVLGSVVLGSLAYYFVWARKSYRGPIVEVNVYAL